LPKLFGTKEECNDTTTEFEINVAGAGIKSAQSSCSPVPRPATREYTIAKSRLIALSVQHNTAPSAGCAALQCCEEMQTSLLMMIHHGEMVIIVQTMEGGAKWAMGLRNLQRGLIVR